MKNSVNSDRDISDSGRDKIYFDIYGTGLKGYAHYMQAVEEGKIDGSDNNFVPADALGFDADPFYSQKNIAYLERLMSDIENGNASFSEHELIEY